MEIIQTSQTITIDDFAKCDVRVGLITAAIPVPNSKKLIQLTVDLGTDIGVRTILTGLLTFFPDPSVLAGKKYLFLVNLAPRMMAGIESQGMFLAVDCNGSSPITTQLPDDTPLGARMR
ncbi:MAG: methionine--tRNA ligase subunit beta [Candidatus Roizmanbacteria bacterium]